MIKVYIDWNVMSGMKNGNFLELEKIFKNKEKFILMYSTSHIGDILASDSDDQKQQEIIQQDLDFITSLTDNLCLANSGKEVYFDYLDPRELFENQMESNKLTDNFSIDSLFDFKNDDESLNEILESKKELLKNTQLDPAFKAIYDTPEGAEFMNKLFPGLENDFTMNGFFKSFGLMLENLNEKEGMKDLRAIVQSVGVNSSHFNADRNPFDLIENAYKKNGFVDFRNNYIEKGKNAPAWFDEITNEYILLDLHGFNSDKIKVNDKEKNTFRNTTEDASHSAFATLSDFYITNDTKNLKKTKAVYEKLEIFTKVLKPDEFVEYYKAYLDFNSVLDHFESISIAFGQRDLFHMEFDNEKLTSLTQFSNYYFFNFFNKIILSFSKIDKYRGGFILCKDLPSKHFQINFFDVEKLVKIFVENYGVDNNGKGYLVKEELIEGNWEGRCWLLESNYIKITQANYFFQLYFYPLEKG
jgi:beta-galactosidase beta subunit